MELEGEGITPEDAAALANAAAAERSPTLVIVAGLWLFLYEPRQVNDGAADLLNDLIERDGGAWISCIVDDAARAWTFPLLSANAFGGDLAGAAASGRGSETVH